MTSKPNRRSPSWLLTLLLSYTALLAALTILNYAGADRWWFGAFNLYLPQAVWALPGIFLAAIAFKLARSWIWLPLLGIAWVAGPLMGLCWPVHLPRDVQGSEPLRVMTWNVKYGTHDKLAHLALKHDIEENNPDIVFLQDAGGVLDGLLGKYFKTWNVRSSGQYVIASRLPLGELQVRRMSFQGGDHTCVRTQTQINGTVVALYNVHFESPRSGLNALRVVKRNPQQLPEGVQKFETNVEARFSQVQALHEYIRQERGPVIVAGDLNSPDASQVCATLRDVGLHDAFAEGGKGYGYTYGHFLLQHRLPVVNFSWMRIDHIMLSPQFSTQRCWTGTHEASDHRPVIADLVLLGDT
jgi:endonuclease/exonuclease/phosphatase family metal-dependent hydrolase